MKKLLLAFAMFLVSIALFSQSFNTGEILKPGQFFAGINPVLVDKGLGVYLHGGYGIAKRIDFDFRYGIFEGADYVGADMEWDLRSSRRMDLSLVTGAPC